jgi:hypothetical protein
LEQDLYTLEFLRLRSYERVVVKSVVHVGRGRPLPRLHGNDRPTHGLGGQRVRPVCRRRRAGALMMGHTVARPDAR